MNSSTTGVLDLLHYNLVSDFIMVRGLDIHMIRVKKLLHRSYHILVFIIQWRMGVPEWIPKLALCILLMLSPRQSTKQNLMASVESMISIILIKPYMTTSSFKCCFISSKPPEPEAWNLRWWDTNLLNTILQRLGFGGVVSNQTPVNSIVVKSHWTNSIADSLFIFKDDDLFHTNWSIVLFY